MARRPASGRGWTDDCRATGKSFRQPMEAWWKHEGKNHCAILTILAQFGLVGLSRNWQDMRKKTRFVAPGRISFDTTHNLKAAGSNPAPATKSFNNNSHLRSAPRGAFCICAFTSTPHQHDTRKPTPARINGQWHAAARKGYAVTLRASIQHCILGQQLNVVRKLVPRAHVSHPPKAHHR